MDTQGIPDNLRDDVKAPSAEPASPKPPPRSGDNKWTRLAVGIPITFVVMSLLYGVDQVVQVIVFGTICTLGLGLIAMLFLCWAVGYIVLEVWHSFNRPRTAPTSS